jgi:hypothetical protein
MRRFSATVADALLAPLFVWAVWSAPDRMYTEFVTEDGPLEWLQVLALVVVVGGLGWRALTATTRERRTAFGVGTLLAFVVVGEEVAWGSRLFGVSSAAVQTANVQHDLTLHNLGGFRGLHFSFVAIALLGLAGGALVARWRPGLVLWFFGPALYAAVRVLDNDPITPRFAKVSEILELVLYVAIARVVVGGVGAPAPASAVAVERPAVLEVR